MADLCKRYLIYEGLENSEGKHEAFGFNCPKVIGSRVSAMTGYRWEEGLNEKDRTFQIA